MPPRGHGKYVDGERVGSYGPSDKKKKVVVKPKRKPEVETRPIRPPQPQSLPKPPPSASIPNSAQGRGGSTWEAEKQSPEEIRRKRAAGRAKAIADRKTRARRDKPSSGGFFDFLDRDYTPDVVDRAARGLGESAVGWMMQRANAPKRRGGIYSSQVGRLAGDARVRGLGAGAEAIFGLQMDPNTGRFIMNQDYDPAWAIAGLGFGVMGVGNPAHVSAALGKQALSQADLIAKVAAKQKNSSRVAKVAGDALEKAGFDPEGPVVKLTRNARTDKRVFRNVGEKDVSEVKVDAAKSRTGKLGEKAMDKYLRPWLSKGPDIKGRRIALAKTEREKWAQALEKQAKEAQKQAQIPLVQLDAILGRGVANRWFQRLEVPEFYALRMVGKGVDPGTMINRFKGLAAQARKIGDEAKASRLDYHAAMAEAAAPLVRVSGGDVILSDEASRKLKAVFAQIERAGENRERIYSSLEILDDARAAERITNEELWYYGATWQSTENFINKTIEGNQNRKALLKILRERDPEGADAAIAVIDAQARNWMVDRMARRAEAIAAMRANPTIERDPQQLVLRKRAEAEYKRGLDPDNFYRQWDKTLGEFPDEVRGMYDESVLMEIEPFHTIAETKAAANLRSKLNPKNKLKGQPQNKPIYRTVNGEKLVVAGRVTPAQWVKRVLVVMPDQADRAAWSSWYDGFENTFRAIFGEDADALIRGFAVSQANASPGVGLRSVFKIMEALRDGEKVEKGYGSVVAASIAKAVQNGEIDKGIAAKLSDFIDSLMLSPTRTWMGNAVEGGRPVAVDVHAARDRGLVDRKIRAKLKENFGLEEGVHYTMDNPGGSPSGIKYERVAEWYEDLTDHLNAIAFDGRTDWQPRQVQALGWASIQLLHGVDPQDFGVALSQNTRRVSFEVTQGMEGLGNDLTPEQAQVVAREMESDMRRLVEEAGGYLNGIQYSTDGWAGGLNGAVHLDIIGTDEAVDKMLTLAAQAFDQHLVQGTRTITRAGAKAALVVSSDAFSDDAVRVAFVKRLYELVPDLKAHGFMFDTYEELPAFKIVTKRGYLGPKTVDKFLSKYDAAIAQVEQELGVSVKYGTKNTEIRIGDKVGRADYDATAGRARELDDLDPAARAARERLDEVLARVREAHPASPEQVAARVREQDRAAYDSLLEEIARAKGAKRVTEKQLADAEAESIELADRYPDDPWSLEFLRLRSSLGLDEQTFPDFLFSRANRGRGAADEAAAAGDTPPAGAAPEADAARAADEAARGQALVEKRPGYAEAAEQMRNGTVPVDWLRALVADEWDDYDKWRIGAHLDALVREGGGASIRGMEFSSVPGLDRFLIKTMIRGMFRPVQNELIIGPYGSIPTALHELVHMRQFRDMFSDKFLDDVKQFIGVGDDWSEADMERLADIFEATFLGFKSELSELPAAIKGPLEEVSRAFQKELDEGKAGRAVEMMEKLNEAGPLGQRIVDAVENLHYWRPQRGNKFHGASDQFRDRGKVYMPETLGLPASYQKSLYAVRAFGARLAMGLGHKSKLLPGDKALSHEFTGHLLESGAFDRNVIKGTVYAQMKASKIWGMSVVRDQARKIGHAIPQSSDDVAIPLDASAFTTRQGKDVDFIAGMLNSIEEGKVISEAELSRVDLDAIRAAEDIFFPGVSKKTEDEMKALAEKIRAGVEEPIEGVVWVNRRDLLNTAVFQAPGPRSSAYKQVTGPLNDYLKAMLLALKPSFIPMNFMGNTAMALMQQGAFAPLNYVRAWDLNRRLGDDSVLIDFFAGSGWMKSVFESKGGVPGLSHTLDAVTDVSNWLVDRHWRRAAFLYEAHKMGYKSPEELRMLLKDPKFVDDLSTVSQRTRNAMVDFENLSQLEKDFMNEAFFVYPWFKGSTYWAGRFVKDHPFQSAVYAYLIAQQQDRLEGVMPDGQPGYLKWFLPIGEKERDGREMPYGFRLDQLLTFLTPADLADDAVGLGSGGRLNLFGNSEPEAVASLANPLYEELLKTITGYDSFTGRPVNKGIPDLLMRLLPTERSVVIEQIKNILDEGRRKNSIYKQTETEAWLRLFLGSLSPGVVDPEKAGERAKGLGMERTDEENLDIWKMKARNTFGEEPPPWLVEYKKNQQRYNDMESDYERELGSPDGGMSDQERVVVLMRLLAKRDGRSWSREDDILALDDDTARKLKSDLRRDLGLTQADKFDSAIGAARKEERLNG